MEAETKIEEVAPTKSAKRSRKPVVKSEAKSVAPAVVHVEEKPAEVLAIEEVLAKKLKKIKVVRDSFTMPESEYQKINDIKEACLKAGRHVKKSEVLRAGLQALVNMDEAQLQAALAGLETIRTGRPKKR
jgi:hypothetical protein